MFNERGMWWDFRNLHTNTTQNELFITTVSVSREYYTCPVESVNSVCSWSRNIFSLTKTNFTTSIEIKQINYETVH